MGGKVHVMWVMGAHSWAGVVWWDLCGFLDGAVNELIKEGYRAIW